jgi:hypothetical protein
MQRWHLKFPLSALLLAACAVGLAAPAVAAPLDLKHVAADTKWLAHIDLDAVRASTFAQKAAEKVKQMHPEAETQLIIATQMIGMDPTKDLHGMTFYGSQLGKPAGVGIVHGKFDPERLLRLAATIPNHKADRHGDIDLHLWSFKSRHGEHTVAVAFVGREHMVAASSADELRSALDVLNGAAASASADGPLGGNVPPGTTMLMRVSGVASSGLPLKDPVSKQLDSFRFVAGESEGQSFYRARAEMTNPEIAQQVKEIVEGARALGLIHCQNDVQGKKLIEAVRVKAEGNTLTILWSAPADDVWQVANKAADQLKERMEQRRHKGRRQAEGSRPGPDRPAQPQRSAEEDF